MVSRGDQPNSCSCPPLNARMFTIHYETGDGNHYYFVFRPNLVAEALRLPGRMVVVTNGEFNWDDARTVCDIIYTLGAYDAKP